MNTKLKNLKNQISEQYSVFFGIKPKKTKLKFLNSSNWQEFCSDYNFYRTSEGIYLPRNQTAYLLEDSENLDLNMFHEYFGHGLFFEHSKKGRMFVELEKRLEAEEKKEFGNNTNSIKEILELRKQNPLHWLIQEQKSENSALYEWFALWTEYYLAQQNNLAEKFNIKYKEIQGNKKEILEKLIAFQNDYGEKIFFYDSGMPKYYDAEDIKDISQRLLKEKFNSAKLILLYGSKKPYSDIDLFVVSEEIENFDNHWIDIYSLKNNEFEFMLNNFDVSVTDPLITGEFVAGNKEYFEQKKKQILEQPITEDAIGYNIARSKQQQILAKNYSENSKAYSKGISYCETFLKNALALKNGERKLTKEALINKP